MGRIFAIGDIHGCAKTARKLLSEELKIRTDDDIYFLGDYIDRGSGSKDVIDFILQLKNEQYRVHTLRGNHEQLFMDSDNGFSSFQQWILNGGVATLESFEIGRYRELGYRYKMFFEQTQYYFATDHFIFVHAGFDFSRKNFMEDTDAMLWIRNMKVDKKKLGDKIIIHGHTPTPLEKVKKNLETVRERGSLNIDTGCVMRHHNGLGFLTALDVTTMQLYTVENTEE
jgi:serine/threonine protein phosphatase 1